MIRSGSPLMQTRRRATLTTVSSSTVTVSPTAVCSARPIDTNNSTTGVSPVIGTRSPTPRILPSSVKPGVLRRSGRPDRFAAEPCDPTLSQYRAIEDRADESVARVVGQLLDDVLNGHNQSTLDREEVSQTRTVVVPALSSSPPPGAWILPLTWHSSVTTMIVRPRRSDVWSYRVV